MKFDEKEQHELLQMLLQMSDGVATPEQYGQLDEKVRLHPEIRGWIANSLIHLADLEWETGPFAPSIPAPKTAHPVGECQPTSNEGPAAGFRSHSTAEPSTSWGERLAFSWVGLAASLLLGVGIGWWALQSDRYFVALSGGAVETELSSAPIATLVSNRNLMWDTQAGFPIAPGAEILAGRPVALLEGTAEIQFGSGLNIRVAGPAILSTDEEGVPEIGYGKGLLSNAGEEELHVVLPMATFVIPCGSLLGVDAFGDEVVVHAFEGEALVIPTSAEWRPVHLTAGEGTRLRTDAHSHVSVDKATVDWTAFDFKASVATDELHIPASYPALIRRSRPVAYWRFEDEVDDVVANEMGSSHALTRLGDEVSIHAGEINSYVELHLRESTGGFASADAFDCFQESGYSIEMWVRPSHFHRGVLAALVEQTSDEVGEVERHGLIVETNAAHPIPAGKEGRPKAIRFLHRSPPHDLLGGTSCFATPGYQPRQWQHIAAVKQESSMRIYVDGELAASEEDESRLTGPLQLVVGQLFSFGSVRPFVGDLDELAIYDRALSVEEIRDRVAAVRHRQSNDIPNGANLR